MAFLLLYALCIYCCYFFHVLLYCKVAFCIESDFVYTYFYITVPHQVLCIPIFTVFRSTEEHFALCRILCIPTFTERFLCIHVIIATTTTTHDDYTTRLHDYTTTHYAAKPQSGVKAPFQVQLNTMDPRALKFSLEFG